MLATRCQWGRDWAWGLRSVAQGGLYSEVQGIMDNGHVGTPVNRMTDTCENTTLPQLRWRAVMIYLYIKL